MVHRKFARVALVLAVIMSSIGAASAQDYPRKPIRILVGWSVATPPDLAARIVAEKAFATLGQTIVVDNKPGAGGTLALAEFVKQPPDGYTLMTFNASQTLTPLLYPKLAVDLRKDLAPIILLDTSPSVLVVGPGSPIRSVEDLLARMRAKPGQLFFGSGGTATPAHLSGELLNQRAHVKGVHVPYNQFPQAITDLSAGRVDFMFLSAQAAVPQVKGGKLRALAVTGGKRLGSLPDVPTMHEAGVADFVVENWGSLVAPAGTPAPIIERLNAEFAKALASPDVRERLDQLAAEPIGGTPGDLALRLDIDMQHWYKVGVTAGIKPD